MAWDWKNSGPKIMGYMSDSMLNLYTIKIIHKTVHKLFKFRIFFNLIIIMIEIMGFSRLYRASYSKSSKKLKKIKKRKKKKKRQQLYHKIFDLQFSPAFLKFDCESHQQDIIFMTIVLII